MSRINEILLDKYICSYRPNNNEVQNRHGFKEDDILPYIFVIPRLLQCFL